MDWVTLGSVRRREPQPDFQAGLVVLHFYLRVVEAGDDRREAQAEATARAASAALDPVEALQHMLALLEGYARPMIGDADDWSLAIVQNRHLDITGTAMSYRIVDEVGDSVEEEIPIPEHGHSAGAFEFDVPASFLGRGVEQLRHLAGHLGQVDDAEPAARIQHLDPRDPEQRREHAQDGVELPRRIGDERLTSLTIELLTSSRLQPTAQARQRGSEIVRHVVGDLSDLLHQILDPAEHAVEIGGQLVPFVLRAAQWYPPSKTVLHDLPGGRVHGLDPSDRAPCHEDTGDGGEHERQDCPVEKRRLGDPDESIEIVEASPHQKSGAIREGLVGRRAQDASSGLRLLEVRPAPSPAEGGRPAR